MIPDMTRRRHAAALLTSALLALPACLPAAEPVNFERQIRPLLAEHCASCHGSEKQRGGVAFHRKAYAFRESDAGEPIIVPGDPDKSLLIKMVTHPDEHERMPKDKPALPDATISLLRTWITQGAPWPEDEPEEIHWAYAPPTISKLPATSDNSWPTGPLDHFILARLNQKGMKPSDKANPETLLRRVHLDLIGLPPDLKTIDAFLANPDKQAYEQVVDTLLASPRFGEKWATHWLDLARAADSDGYQRDGFRTVWPYRDYVINAFNNDMPYDRFAIEQIAGDLLPNATQEQKVATVFSRATTHNREAGTDINEDRHKQVVDRVNTFGTVFLGSSLACAQCHNHKYDPYTIREYYEFFAFFNNTPIESRAAEGDSTISTIGPMLALEYEPLAADKERRETLKKRFLEAVQKKHTDAPPETFEDALALFKKHHKKNNALKKLSNQINQIDRKPTVPVMSEMKTPRMTTLFSRGDWKKPGIEVSPDVPSFLNSFPEDAPRNRLGLAQWVASRENPLIARTAVNRFWAELFGQGIVTTPEDLGKQGLPPSHPELLDYLAVSFMENGWSMKQLIKEIVMSSTYRQSSIANAELLDADPNNIWLARGPRFRISAEATRDTILYISGLLSDKLGGPVVYPPQPDKIWRVTGQVDNTYHSSDGENRYRRGIYTIWRRHAHYPSFANFDAPNRGACTVQRTRSNTPLQALTLMNDPVYVEAAHAFADRLKGLEGRTIEDKLTQAVRLAYSRLPTDKELNILKDAHADNDDPFGQWFSVASILINASPTITKD